MWEFTYPMKEDDTESNDIYHKLSNKEDPKGDALAMVDYCFIFFYFPILLYFILYSFFACLFDSLSFLNSLVL
jgi:hypothetical protein